MKVRNKGKILACLGVLAVILLVFAMLELSWAATFIPLNEVIDTIFGHGTWANNILVKDNAVRMMMALMVGAGLAVCGCTMQAIFRNPMASPYIVGLSSGASLGAAIGILVTIPMIPFFLLAPVLSFVFCLLTMFLVYGVSRMGGKTHTETLILTGIAVSSLLTAIVSFLTFIAGDAMADIVFWNMGSLARADLTEAVIVAPIILVGILLVISYSKDLNAMMLGDHHAMDLGIDVSKVRLSLLIITTLIVAAAVAFAGAIGFVGLVIPHIFRIILGPDNRVLIPISAIGGAAFLMMCDFFAHIVAPQYGVLPVGILTAMIGAPYFIYLLRRKKNEVGW